MGIKEERRNKSREKEEGKWRMKNYKPGKGYEKEPSWGVIAKDQKEGGYKRKGALKRE